MLNECARVPFIKVFITRQKARGVNDASQPRRPPRHTVKMAFNQTTFDNDNNNNNNTEVPLKRGSSTSPPRLIFVKVLPMKRHLPTQYNNNNKKDRYSFISRAHCAYKIDKRWACMAVCCFFFLLFQRGVAANSLITISSRRRVQGVREQTPCLIHSVGGAWRKACQVGEMRIKTKENKTKQKRKPAYNLFRTRRKQRSARSEMIMKKSQIKRSHYLIGQRKALSSRNSD